MSGATVTVLTWNLKGASPKDLARVVAEVGRHRPDVVLLQEVRPGQARHVARALGARSRRWSLKHWPVVRRPEGLAVVGVTGPVAVRAAALTARWRFWSSARRIAQVGRFARAGGQPEVVVVNVHLSPGRAGRRRDLEVDRVLGLVASARSPVVVGGDLNVRPGDALLRRLALAGLSDAWGAVRPGDDEQAAATNWHGWARTRTGPPGQRLDYLLAGPGLAPVAVASPRYGEDGFADLALLSDHLPVAATFAPGPDPASGSR